MPIRVAGRTGFVGSHTIRSLLFADHDVKLLVRNEEKALCLWAEEPRVLEDLVVGNLNSSPATVDALRDCNGLVHTAAPVALAVSKSEARAIGQQNRCSLRLPIDRALDDGLKCTSHLSTTALFDTIGHELTDEDTPLNENGDTYGLSTTAPENNLRQLQDKGAPISIVSRRASSAPMIRGSRKP